MTNLTHNSFLYMFISILYMFRAFKCSSSGDSILFFFCICLFQFSTCFEHSSAHHQVSQFYSFLYMFISILYMFRAFKWSSSGDSILFFFCICLFKFSTCFEHSSAHHQVIQFYQYDIWYLSFCVGDRLLCRFGRNSKPAYQTVIYIEWHIPDIVLIKLNLLMMSTWMLETCRELS